MLLLDGQPCVVPQVRAPPHLLHCIFLRSPRPLTSLYWSTVRYYPVVPLVHCKVLSCPPSQQTNPLPCVLFLSLILPRPPQTQDIILVPRFLSRASLSEACTRIRGTGPNPPSCLPHEQRLVHVCQGEYAAVSNQRVQVRQGVVCSCQPPAVPGE